MRRSPSSATHAPVLLCTQSGGEGRNIQFCNTLINFDVPWNPMAIEQRIGRIDRIGQSREVFVFNLVTRGTLEEQVLALLDEKISMFELVVGEVGAILGGLEEERDFPDLVLDAWLEATEAGRAEAFDALGRRLDEARGQHEDAKALDDDAVRRRFRDGVRSGRWERCAISSPSVLESEGAAIEPVEPDGLEVLAPEPLRAAMGWPELVRLGFGAELPAGAMPIGLEGDWLDRFGALLGERGRWAERQVALADITPPGDPERLLERALDLPNAVWRFHGVAAGWTRCLLLAFRYTAISDEKREGLVWLGFNQGTGAVIDEAATRLRALLAEDAEWRAPDPEVRRARRQRLGTGHARGAGSRRCSTIMCGASWRPSCAPCAVGSTATATASTSITTTCARPRCASSPPCPARRAKRRRRTASARRCGSPRSSANTPPSSTTCATITRCA